MTADREAQAQTQADAAGLAELREQCGRSFDRVAGLTKPQDSEWLALDMGMGQLKAMVVLAKHRQLTVGGLARALDISEPSASLLVDKLVTRGLVARETDPADRRRTRWWPPNRETYWSIVCAEPAGAVDRVARPHERAGPAGAQPGAGRARGRHRAGHAT